MILLSTLSRNLEESLQRTKNINIHMKRITTYEQEVCEVNSKYVRGVYFFGINGH